VLVADGFARYAPFWSSDELIAWLMNGFLSGSDIPLRLARTSHPQQLHPRGHLKPQATST
jgi:hypothetical protein